MNNLYPIKSLYFKESNYIKFDSGGLCNLVLNSTPLISYLVIKMDTMKQSQYSVTKIADFLDLSDFFKGEVQFGSAYIRDNILTIEYKIASDYKREAYFNLTTKIQEIKRVRSEAGVDIDGNSKLGLVDAKHAVEVAMNNSVNIELTKCNSPIPEIEYDPNEKLDKELLNSTRLYIDKVLSM